MKKSSASTPQNKPSTTSHDGISEWRSIISIQKLMHGPKLNPQIEEDLKI
jgi:hypothetical protein